MQQFILHSTYCHVKFTFKFSDKMVNNRDFLKIINLYILCFKSFDFDLEHQIKQLDINGLQFRFNDYNNFSDSDWYNRTKSPLK